MILPRYPIYIPSKGRHQYDRAYTVRFLRKDGVPFRLVCEPQEREEYTELLGGEDDLLVLPKNNGRLIFARNWIMEHSIAEGHERHWQLDDNMLLMRRPYRRRRIACNSGPAFAAVEDFTDRYENIAISGINYDMFATPDMPPVRINAHVYSTSLINNAIPHRWRLIYNDDTDMCLQVIADGWCTVRSTPS
jgi:hypothetical protein